MDEVAPPREGECVYCGVGCGSWLTCTYHAPLLALDPNYSAARDRLDESDYLPGNAAADG